MTASLSHGASQGLTGPVARLLQMRQPRPREVSPAASATQVPVEGRGAFPPGSQPRSISSRARFPWKPAPWTAAPPAMPQAGYQLSPPGPTSSSPSPVVASGWDGHRAPLCSSAAWPVSVCVRGSLQNVLSAAQGPAVSAEARFRPWRGGSGLLTSQWDSVARRVPGADVRMYPDKNPGSEIAQRDLIPFCQLTVQRRVPRVRSPALQPPCQWALPRLCPSPPCR